MSVEGPSSLKRGRWDLVHLKEGGDLHSKLNKVGGPSSLKEGGGTILAH